MPYEVTILRDKIEIAWTENVEMSAMDMDTIIGLEAGEVPEQIITRLIALEKEKKSQGFK